MKTLNDTLREEFNKALSDSTIQQYIRDNEINNNLLQKAFDILLSYKNKKDEIDKARTEFENYLINSIKQTK
jgi:hypothetical protein